MKKHLSAHKNTFTTELAKEMHSIWLKGYRDSFTEKGIKCPAKLKKVEISEGEFSALKEKGFPEIKLVEDNGKLFLQQNINQEADKIVPKLNQQLNGDLATLYTPQLMTFFRETPTKETVLNLARTIHAIWLDQNKDWAPAEQKHDFDYLSLCNQLKDLDIIDAAILVIERLSKKSNPYFKDVSMEPYKSLISQFKLELTEKT